ncbi:extracellular solute-binding protein [Microvirga sp. W0021]|uniref:Extracellular solute-binding protein n=1 Tax=Hohaiivirga grylli TaxID=3133970 RepID=A0ABV0BM32_9HYPH
MLSFRVTTATMFLSFTVLALFSLSPQLGAQEIRVAQTEAEAPLLEEKTALAMHGAPALAENFNHFPYANPKAPKGGKLVVALQGTYDSLNPYIVFGVAPDIGQKYVLQSLMARSMDEPFTLYAQIAESYEMPESRNHISFNLDERAKFSDGTQLTAEDVAFSFEMLKQNGKPYHRSSFSAVRSVKVVSPQRIEFDLTGSQDRELPLIIATMPIFAKHATDPETFSNTTLKPIIGSGPYAFSEISPGESVTVKRRNDYWAADLPTSRGLYNFDEIKYDFYRDANTLFESFKAGLYDYRLESDATRWVNGYNIPAVANGTIIKESVPIQTPKGMRGFVFNTRRPVFADVKVREALSYLFDFEWVNRNLYQKTLKRSNSYFNASELSSNGTSVSEREADLLAPYLASIPDDILEGKWRAPNPDGSGRDRSMARKALQLLHKAGWVKDGEILRNSKTRETLSFEFMVTSVEQERLAINYAASLKRLGVICTVRRVDDVQFWRRISDFDFDMIQWNWPVSASPGTEQRGRWSSAAAARTGSLNYAGVTSPAVDGMVDALLSAETREDFISAVHALDRVLLAGFYVVPLFYSPDQWVVYSSKLKHPETHPFQGVAIESWWSNQLN